MRVAGSLPEAKYRLESAMRRRGLVPIVNGRTFGIEHDFYNYSLSFMPGNPRVLISHGVWIDPSVRNRGWGRKLMNMREKIAIDAGANLLLATVKNDNAVEIHLLKTSGWKRLTNRKDTGVSLWGKQL